MDFMYLFTAFLWFLGKFIVLGLVAFAGVMVGIRYRKGKNLKEQA